jgi:hypothetical protein
MKQGRKSVLVFLERVPCCFADLTCLRARAHQGSWQPQCNRNFRELLSGWIEHMLLNGAAQIEETALPFLSISRKLRLHCGCQFPWCALGLKFETSERYIRNCLHIFNDLAKYYGFVACFWLLNRLQIKLCIIFWMYNYKTKHIPSQSLCVQ